MFSPATRTEPDHHGHGHYSDDQRWWWDESEQHWHRLSDETETLEIVLEDVGDRSWVNGVLSTLGSQSGSRFYRFVGLIRAGDPQPTACVESGSFLSPGPILAELPPSEQWTYGMTDELDQLRKRLAADGWVPLGRGIHPWSYSYFRPRLEPDEPIVPERSHAAPARDR